MANHSKRARFSFTTSPPDASSRGLSIAHDAPTRGDPRFSFTTSHLAGSLSPMMPPLEGIHASASLRLRLQEKRRLGLTRSTSPGRRLTPHLEGSLSLEAVLFTRRRSGLTCWPLPDAAPPLAAARRLIWRAFRTTHLAGFPNDKLDSIHTHLAAPLSLEAVLLTRRRSGLTLTWPPPDASSRGLPIAQSGILSDSSDYGSDSLPFP